MNNVRYGKLSKKKEAQAYALRREDKALRKEKKKLKKVAKRY